MTTWTDRQRDIIRSMPEIIIPTRLIFLATDEHVDAMTYQKFDIVDGPKKTADIVESERKKANLREDIDIDIMVVEGCVKRYEAATAAAAACEHMRLSPIILPENIPAENKEKLMKLQDDVLNIKSKYLAAWKSAEEEYMRAKKNLEEHLKEYNVISERVTEKKEKEKEFPHLLSGEEIMENYKQNMILMQ